MKVFRFLVLLASIACLVRTEYSTAQQASSQTTGERPLGSEYGFMIFQERCTACHGNPDIPKAPTLTMLRELPAERIFAALTSGAMQIHAQGLSEQQILRVAESVSGRLLGSEQAGDAALMPNQCATRPPLRDLDAAHDWNGWGGDAANTRFRSAAAAGINAADIPRLKLKWSFGFPGGVSAFGQPSVAGGRVFVGTDTGYVYSIDAATGCVYWSFRTVSNVRSSVSVGPVSGNGATRYAAYFGDLKANVYAVDAETGALLWSRRADEHFTARVTAAPALHDGHLYVPVASWEEASARILDYSCCTFRGSVVALDANTGAVLWKTYTIDREPAPTKKNSKGVQQWAPAGVAVWNTPVIDAKRQALYFGTGDSYTYPAAPTSDAILALDLRSGRLLWSYQVHPNDAYLVGCERDLTENCPLEVGKDWDIPAPAILRTLPDGGDALIISTKPGDVLALDPDQQGMPRWRTNVAENKSGYGGMRWGGAADATHAYFGLMSGGIVAVELATGTRSWFTQLAPEGQRVGHDTPATLIDDVALLGGTDGLMHGIAVRDGARLWQFDTARDFTTVNGVAAKGGSISSAGAVAAGGMVFIGSGYMVISGKSGNVLLAFAVE